MHAEIHVIGGMSAAPPEAAALAASLLELPPKALEHGGAFTGKPITRVRVSDHWVLKSNRNRRFSALDTARAWAADRIARERACFWQTDARPTPLFHPLRLWLVWREEGRWQAGNLSPRLTPLHMLRLEDLPDPLAPILALCDHYLRFHARFGERLDEGLSNFGMDDDGQVYYLDDDFFSWDDYASFSAMLCRWLRESSGTWLEPDAAARLGEHLRARLLELREAHDVEQIHAAVKDQYLDDAAETSRRALLQGLMPPARTAAAPRRELDMDAPVGLMADIHANLPALEAALALLESCGVRQFLVLGDVVGYGPYPSEVIARLIELGATVIRGNHDHYIGHLGQTDLAMNRSGAWAAHWTMARLGREERQWLAELPARLSPAPGVLAVHGAPVDRHFFRAYVYASTYERNLAHMRERGLRLCLHGHSHLQGVHALRDGMAHDLDATPHQDMTGCEAALVNPGSVGQPRGGRPGAEAAIWHPAEGRLELLRADYDPLPVMQRMLEEGFPEQLVQRLKSGR